MRVLVVTNMYPSAEFPAAGTFVAQQIEGLVDQGQQIEVMLVDRLHKGPQAYQGLGAKVARRAERCRADLVHVMYGGVMAKSVVKAGTGRPVIVSFCGSDLLGERLPGLLRKLAVAYGVWCSRFAASHADGVVVKSKNLLEALPYHVDRQWVSLIPNGVDLEQFKPMETSQCRRLLGWGSERFHVLFPANSGSPVKRFWLAQAAARQAQSAGLAVELHRLEGVRHQDVPVWLNASDCLILTSEHEGSPNIIKEALACNVPVVAVDVGDVAERVYGITGCHLCAPHPQMLARGLAAVARGPRRVRGRRAVEELSLQKVAGRLVDFYGRVRNRREQVATGNSPERVIQAQANRL